MDNIQLDSKLAIKEELGYLIWWVAKEDRKNLSGEAIVEAILSSGTEKEIKRLFKIFGEERVAAIFRK